MKKNGKHLLLVGRTTSGRIDWESRATITALELARHGFTGPAIHRETGLSPGQVYNRVKKKGFRITDYRNGRSDMAIKIIRRYSIMR